MEKSSIKSDKLNNLSERTESNEKSSCSSLGSYSSPPKDETRVSKGLTHRTIQKMWETWMQMRLGKGSWPQILPVGKLSWESAGNDLCSPELCEAGKRISRQSCRYSGTSGRDLRDQSPAIAETRGVLSVDDGIRAACQPFGICRSIRFGNFGCQHDSGLFNWKFEIWRKSR